ncbi:MAG: hypothetical protein JNK54_07225 [Elusimicrobia bacterium]|nr:hypothetical protein [Elusimicrobiota bacterium]
MKGLRAEYGVLAMAVVLYLWTVGIRALHGSVSWGRSAVYLPTGLLVLALINNRLRAKGLAWGLFTGALFLFLVILGTWVVVDRALVGLPAVDFFRSMGFYVVLAVGALMQLRSRNKEKSGKPA